MIPRDELPEDAADWTNVSVTFDRLTPDTADSCPETVAEIMEYVHMESADLDDAQEDSLAFVRTARVDDQNCWLWTYTESDGEVSYVLFQHKDDGGKMLGMSMTNGLSPEQYLLAAYYDEVYWD